MKREKTVLIQVPSIVLIYNLITVGSYSVVKLLYIEFILKRQQCACVHIYDDRLCFSNVKFPVIFISYQSDQISVLVTIFYD